MSDIFELASRTRIRFNSPKGALTVEDLWSLPLQSETGKANLDDIGKAFRRELKASEEESLVTPSSDSNNAAQLGLDIVKRIIKVKQDERDAAKLAGDRAEKKRLLLEAISAEEHKELTSGSLADLKARLAAL